MVRSVAAVCTMLAALLGAASTGSAQGLSALKEHDVDQPIVWEANRSEVMGREDAAMLIGDVHVRQGDLELFSDRLHVFYRLAEAATDPVLERLDATGNVRLQSPSETAHSDWGVYDITERLITLGGGVRLTRGDSRLDGERLEIDLESGVTKLDGRPTATSEGRVRGRFVLPERDGNGEPDDGGGAF